MQCFCKCFWFPVLKCFIHYDVQVGRDPVQLVRETVFQLNQLYVRRINTPRVRDSSSTTASTTAESMAHPLASARVCSNIKSANLFLL